MTINPIAIRASPIDDPRIEPRSHHSLTLSLPLGLTLEQMDVTDPSYGVVIVGISPDGNAANHNSNVFSNLSQSDPSAIGPRCICIRDTITSVNGTPCHDENLENVMQLIIHSESKQVTIELGRIKQSTIVHYSRGRCIAAKPGESYGFLAQKCRVDITYECRTGNCQTCSRWMEFPDKRNSEKRGTIYGRSILNCVGTVPKNYDWLSVYDEVSAADGFCD
jgi:hypothetical protein